MQTDEKAIAISHKNLKNLTCAKKKKLVQYFCACVGLVGDLHRRTTTKTFQFIERVAGYTMDLLASLHLDELPEQQTRISHLAEALADDTDLRLGFNACCSCAKRSPLMIECRGCRLVKYCSIKCQQQDANFCTAAAVAAVDEEDHAMGHSSVVCALLRLCQADEDADNSNLTDTTTDEAAQDRVRSEYESYPATLANVLLNVPCYKVMLARCVHSKAKELVIHVIGASVDAELWGRETSELEEVWDAYADALQELVEANGLKTIRLSMIGPDCPSKAVVTERRIPFTRKNNSSSFCHLIVTTYKDLYSKKLFQAHEQPLTKPDVIVFFNPGFTCPDYSWDSALSCVDYGTSFLLTTNTEMEGIGDCHFLLERKLLPSLPPVAAAIIGSDLVDENSDVVFGENPFAGSRVRQSGTMANDLFVKSRWMLAGVFAKPVHTSLSSQRIDSKHVSPEKDRPTKKLKSEQNKKRTNPALI